jgi:PEP-CTERM motif
MQLRKYLAAPFAALLLTGASLANAAAPIDVTWNPSAVPGLSTAGAFTFDNILLNSYAAIDITGGGTTFSEQGFVSLAGFSNNNVFTSIPTAGFPGGATPYSLYISFTAAGTQSPGIPSTGIFTSLNYSLLAAPGATTFTANASGIFAPTGSPTITLATGTLNGPGSTSLTGTPPDNLLPAANVLATFAPNPAFAGFFVNPNASQILDLSAAFTNTGSVITNIPLGGGNFRLSLNGGGGNATFAVTNVPEPDTYGMLLAGLGLFAFIARRRGRKVA